MNKNRINSWGILLFSRLHFGIKTNFKNVQAILTKYHKTWINMQIIFVFWLFNSSKIYFVTNYKKKYIYDKIICIYKKVNI